MALFEKEKSLEKLLIHLENAVELLDVDLKQVIELKKIEQFVLIQEHLLEIACDIKEIKKKI